MYLLTRSKDVWGQETVKCYCEMWGLYAGGLVGLHTGWNMNTVRQKSWLGNFY